MRKSIVTIVGLCFLASASAAETVKGADAAKLTESEAAYIYLQANAFEVERARLGIACGTAPEVMQHAEMVAKDHGAVIAAFVGLFAEQRFKLTAPSDDAATVHRHQAIMDDLKRRSGADFDREYLTEAIITHRAFIASVREMLPAVSNPALAAHLKEVLPAFKQHLALTIDATRKLNVSSAR